MYSKSEILKSDFNEYDKVFMELEALQKQFDRMKQKRKNNINLLKLKRQNEIKKENRMQSNYTKITCVLDRKKIIDHEKQQQKILISQNKQKKRQNRLDMLKKIGKSNLIHAFTSNNNISKKSEFSKTYEKRRKRVLQNKNDIENEKKLRKKNLYKLKKHKFTKITMKPNVLRSNSVPMSSRKYKNSNNNNNISNIQRNPLTIIDKNTNKFKTKKNTNNNNNKMFHFMKPTMAQYMNNKNLSKCVF